MAQSPVSRRLRIIELLGAEALSTAELAQRLGCGERTVSDDLRWLRLQCPTQLQEQRGGDARHIVYRLVGLPPTPLPAPIEHLNHDELMALIAARGLLRAPDAEGRRPEGWERPSAPYGGDLSAAVHGLLERAGLGAEARLIAPSALSTSRFAVAADPPGAVGALLHALSTGAAVRFRYRTRQGEERERHVLPLRLVFIRGEAHAFCWSPDGRGGGGVRQFRVSRIRSRDPAVAVVAGLPPGCPPRPARETVDAMLATGFNATGSADPAQRRQVVVAIHSEAWPDVVDRCWGEHQQAVPAPDLGPDWRRLSFFTSGLPECRGWILSLGAAARAESPPELVAWCLDQCRRLVAVLAGPAAPGAPSPG